VFGGITPPLGYTVFVFKAAAPDVPSCPIFTVALLAVVS
jgi:hypothetical protein